MRPDALPDIWHGVRVGVAPERCPPFSVDARIAEDDTWRILTADPHFHATTEHPIRLMRDLRDAEPLAPGTVVFEPGPPVRLRAIVYDLDRDPCWREEWVGAALARCLEIAAERGLRSLALPVLGTHARVPPETTLDLLEAALTAPSAPLPRRLWLIFP